MTVRSRFKGCSGTAVSIVVCSVVVSGVELTDNSMDG